VFEDTNGLSEAVNRMTDNTMTKNKKPNNDIQNITQKTKDRPTRTPLKPGWINVQPKGSSSWSTYGIRCVTIVANTV